MRVKIRRKYRIPKMMLVPAQWQGSVEHFYHFMLGYFVPVALWQKQTNSTDFAVRDCGPMNPWFELLAPDTSIEFIKPGVMLERTLTHRQELQVLWHWDNPTRFHRSSLTKCRTLIRDRVMGVDKEISSGTPLRITVLERKVSSDFYQGENTEVIGSGALVRSIPNLGQLGEYISNLGEITFADSAELTPQQQVELFSRTDVFIGQHGAGLSNMLWMNPGALVIEIQPPLPPTIDTIFQNLAGALGLKHVLVRQEHEHANIDLAAVAGTILHACEGSVGGVPALAGRFPLNVIRQLPRSW